MCLLGEWSEKSWQASTRTSDSSELSWQVSSLQLWRPPLLQFMRV